MREIVMREFCSVVICVCVVFRVESIAFPGGFQFIVVPRMLLFVAKGIR